MSDDKELDSIISEEFGLDFSEDQAIISPTELAYISEEYDPRPQEDQARRNIAYLLIALLFVLISGILILTAFQTIEIKDIKEFAVILGPVVTLVSAATGFYYGTKNNNS